MLTLAASEDRAWCGLSIIRQILGDKRQDFENGFYPISISNAEFDHYRRFAVLGGLVSAHRDALAASLTSEPPGPAREKRTEEALQELSHIADVLRSLASRLERASSDVRSVQEHLWQRRNDTDISEHSL